MIGKNIYFDFVGPSVTLQFLICQRDDIGHHLIHSLIFANVMTNKFSRENL